MRNKFKHCPKEQSNILIITRSVRVAPERTLPERTENKYAKHVIYTSFFYGGPQGTRCKHKRNAANKKETLQIKKKRCKQKRNAANKRETLQTKKESCKQKRNAANKKEALQTKKGTAANQEPITSCCKYKKKERCK